ncbi:MAG: T9SS type A sorting domain-containing protein [Paraprevotella sp.]|nr:T9SS type A sorting domain-containing protein [Paraprevotella sp.]
MNKYILSWALWCISLCLQAQALGSWKTYPAYQIATMNVPVGDKIYSLCNGNLFSYNTADSEVFCYDRVNQLNDCNIKFIDYCTSEHKLILVYENGNIDLLYDNGEITNLPQLKNKTLISKAINNLSIYENMAYIATSFGVVIVDMKKEEIADTYDFNENITAIAANSKYIYITTKEEVFLGDKTLNLKDKNNWTLANEWSSDKLIPFDGTIFSIRKNVGLYKHNPQTGIPSYVKADKFIYLSLSDGKLIAGSTNKIYIFETADKCDTIKYSNDFQYLTYHKGQYWASRGLHGLQPYKMADGKFTATQGVIQPDSPVRNYACYLKFVGERLLVAGAFYNYTGKVYEGTVMYYEDGKWTNFEEEDIPAKTGVNYQNTTTIVQDPSDPSHHFVTSTRDGMYEFKDGKFVHKYDCRNSSLYSIEPNEPKPYKKVCTSGATYDKEGNLWVINNEVDTIIKVMKPDGKWVRLYYPELAGIETCDFFTFDSNGNIWVNSRRARGRGIFVLNTNGTLENTSDDVHYLRQGITNQDGTSYNEISEYYCVTEDLDGRLWVGTSQGPFVINNPSEFMNSDFYYEQIKIARNDGSNLADYLLDGIAVTCITVDGANRKWIGTGYNGVYLISADGQEMIQHFTTENSPLLSDNIYSIAIHPRTGEVFFGTGNGLISYASDATTPEDKLEDDNIYAYPNPVKPDYNGLVSVVGLTRDSEVKVTTATGQLVYSGTSNGGMFTWNVRNLKGKRVSSGVYNVIASTADGGEAVVTKIVVIN